MNNKTFELGSKILVIGLLLLSLQLYGLSLIQVIDMETGSWQTNAINYLREPHIKAATNISKLLILYGVGILFSPLIIKFTKNHVGRK